MKDELREFFRPTEDEYKRLWQEATLVFDTNVLLDLYRLPNSVATELLKVLRSLSPRIWIPFQVALEYQRNRLSVITALHKSDSEAMRAQQLVSGQVKKTFEEIQPENWGVQVDEQLFEKFSELCGTFVALIGKVCEAQEKFLGEDPIRNALSEILEGRVGKNPNDTELAEFVKDAEHRYQNRVSPGYLDQAKEKNPAESTFSHRGLIYQRKHGDLIVWKQLLQHAKEKAIKVVLFVTADNKEDWWWKEYGRTLGPKPELIREISDVAGVELFWMYSISQFVNHARTYVKSDISESAVQVINEIESSATPSGSQDLQTGTSSYRPIPENLPSEDWSEEEVWLDEPIVDWLFECHDEVIGRPSRFPRFIASRGEIRHGVEVREIARIGNALAAHTYLGILNAARDLVRSGEITNFTLLLVLRDRNVLNLASNVRSDIVVRLRKYVSRSKGLRIVVGVIAGTDFTVLGDTD